MSASGIATPRTGVIIIGGGHNGLVTAGLLAKRGIAVTVLERRDVVGGAAITEQPWGPDWKVTALSYVMSLMPKAIVEELHLARFGYHVYPQHPYFVAHPDGRYLMMANDPARRHAEISKFSSRDADAMVEWDAWLGRLGEVLGPLLSTVPPRVGRKRPADLLAQLGVAWKFRKLDERGIADVTRLMTMSVADLLEERFESDAVRGVLAVSGVIGTWAGPRSPGTGYVMAHHKIGDVGDGQVGSWGFPAGGMGGVTTAMRDAAVALGATVRTDAPVAKIKIREGRAEGVVLASGEELDADAIVSTAHPQVTFLKLIDRADLPAEFVADIERWKSRSGTVKVNLALDRLPDFRAKPGFDPEVHGGTIVLAHSLDEIEGAFQDAVGGRAARLPFADLCIPSVFDPTLAPPGKHVMSMFTQWVPHTWASEPHADELAAYADRLIARVEDLAPGFRDSILHRQIIGPHEMATKYGLVGGNIFHGELSANQLFHLRPAVGYADFTTPIRGLYHASSATHGGGGVTGIPALQVVKRLRKDGVACVKALAAVAGALCACSSSPSPSPPGVDAVCQMSATDPPALVAERGFLDLDPQPTTPFTGYMFYAFFPADQHSASAPLLVLFNGGPGFPTSAGLLADSTAPFAVDGSGDVVANPASLTSIANVLYLDQREAGLSFDDAPASGPDVESFAIDDDAADFALSITRFVGAHPALHCAKIVLIGESYGGVRAEAMLAAFLHYQTTAPAVAGELQAYFDGMFGASAGTGTEYSPIAIARQFPAQLLIEPNVMGAVQSRETTIGPGPGQCEFDTREDEAWCEQLGSAAAGALADLSRSQTWLGGLLAAVPELTPANHHGFRLPSDQVSPLPPTAGANAQLVSELGALGSGDAYYATGQLSIVWNDPASPGPDQFIDDLYYVSTFITVATFDASIDSTAIARALTDSGAPATIDASSPAGAARPGTMDVSLPATADSGARNVQIRFPTYSAGHEVTTTQAQEFHDDAQQFLEQRGVIPASM